MTREDIIRMAQQAGMREGESGDWTAADAALTYPECVYTENLERFANLVAAAERERIIAANAPEIEKVNVYIKALEDAVAAEREACAKVCEAEGERVDASWVSCAFAIRERGQ